LLLLLPLVQLLAGLLSSYCNSLLVLLLLLQHLLGRGQAGWGVFSAGCGAESAAVNRSSPPLLCGPGSVGHQDVLFPSPQSISLKPWRGHFSARDLQALRLT